MPTTAPPVPGGATVSSAGYWIGGAILLLGCGAAIVWFVVVIVGLVNAPDDFDRVRVPGRTVVTLDDGDWMIYQEYPGADSGRFLAPPQVIVTGPSGRDVSLRTVSSSYTYTTGSREGMGLWEFTAPTAGAYTIETSVVGEPTLSGNQTVAIGRPLFDTSEIGGIVGSLALGAVSFLVGLVILIVTIVRRGRARRRAQPALAPYGAVPYGMPPPGAAPYGPPGGWSPPASAGWTPPPPSPSPPPAPPPMAPPSPWSPPGESAPSGPPVGDADDNPPPH
jgi:hypothetical protein